jgi:UDP-N-acetylglucosamine 2-epimerase (non-hydrolysing)
MNKRIAVFIGTRPEAIKMAPVIKALQATEGMEPIVVSTGQHREMLQQVVDIFDLPVHHDLDVMVPNQTLAGLSARLLERIDAFLVGQRPDFALVQGDTTTVLMAALACFYRKIPVGHVEAGLRTGNMASPFPEEANRTLVTPIAKLHFAPTLTSKNNLLAAGVDEQLISVTGNTVIDALHLEIQAQSKPEVRDKIDAALDPYLGKNWRNKPFVLITGHRRENFGGGFDQICEAITQLAKRFTNHRFIYPVHLNPNVQGPVQQQLAGIPNIFLLPPQSYRPFVALMKACRLVLTDSGGVQEEAPGLGKPVLVMRDTTERPEGVEAGTVRLVGADCEKIVRAVDELLNNPLAYQAMAKAKNPYGDGKASVSIVSTLSEFLILGKESILGLC